jgi:hypothetical protein
MFFLIPFLQKMKPKYLIAIAVALGSLILLILLNDTVRGYFGLQKTALPTPPPIDDTNCDHIAIFIKSNFYSSADFDELEDVFSTNGIGIKYSTNNVGAAFANNWNSFSGKVFNGVASNVNSLGSWANGGLIKNLPIITNIPSPIPIIEKKYFKITNQVDFKKVAAARQWKYGEQCVGAVILN